MTALPDSIRRQLGRTTWPVEMLQNDPEDRKTERFVAVCERIAYLLQVMERRALNYAEARAWNPLDWFVPRAKDSLAVYLLARSGDLAVRVVAHQRRYRITEQGRRTLDDFRFARA